MTKYIEGEVHTFVIDVERSPIEKVTSISSFLSVDKLIYNEIAIESELWT